MYFIKNFVDWFKLKPALDQKDSGKTYINEGEIWWCSVGENIGSEISGKDILFLRPILIIRKFSNSTFSAIPITSKPPKKLDTYFYKISVKNKPSYLCLHQIKFYDKKRLLRRIETVSENQYSEILAKFISIYSK